MGVAKDAHEYRPFESGGAWRAEEIVEQGGSGFVEHGRKHVADSAFGNVAMSPCLASVDLIWKRLASFLRTLSAIKSRQARWIACSPMVGAMLAPISIVTTWPFIKAC